MSRHDWAASESEGPILQIVVQRKRAEERDDTDREGADVCVSDPRQAQFAKLMSQRLSFDFTCASSCIAPSQRCIIEVGFCGIYSWRGPEALLAGHWHK